MADYTSKVIVKKCICMILRADDHYTLFPSKVSGIMFHPVNGEELFGEMRVGENKHVTLIMTDTPRLGNQEDIDKLDQLLSQEIEKLQKELSLGSCEPIQVNCAR